VCLYVSTSQTCDLSLCVHHTVTASKSNGRKKTPSSNKKTPSSNKKESKNDSKIKPTTGHSQLTLKDMFGGGGGLVQPL